MTAMRIGVIFDCDGTLLDSAGVWREVEDELARRVGVRLAKADTDELTTLTIPEAGAFFHERFGLGRDAADVVGMIDELMLAYYRERACERPGALAFVRALAERGVAMSVASSSPQAYLQTGLATAGFLPYLDAVVSVDDVGRSKREPAVYDHARALMGTSLRYTWGFEDSAYAVRTLRAAGYRTVGVYDCDLAGAYEELAALCDHAVRGFDELDADEFVTWGAALSVSPSFSS
ncbi:HAD family hydrolase [Gordonibacter sp. An230]|uniref:HAD family hydrolase n=1 Tax=Gordonibacter sp. An230 TaxID=1965592 RepID=UPI000B377D27|nr:HAD family phosphatase [Gordonibacter sp. An230]OUO89853.1 HAD family hydrolase [Gordonibacter sp. An230]